MKLFKLLLALPVIACSSLKAQPPINTNKKGGGYTFVIEKQIGCTPVKNQNKSVPAGVIPHSHLLNLN